MASGAPKTTFNVKDESIIITTPVKGIICLQGETMLGKTGVPKFISNSGKFLREFGSYHPNSPFPKYVLRLLDSGAKLYISRAGQYTDPLLPDSLVGVKAIGNITVLTDVLNIEAIEVGAGFNDVTVTVKDASSLDATKCDIQVSVVGVPGAFDVRDIDRTLDTAEKIANANQKLEDNLRHIQIVSVVGVIVNGSTTLTGGVEDVSLINDASFNGTSAGQTGWYSFGTVTDAFRIANIHRPSPTVDIALSNYVNSRGGDMRFAIGGPVGATIEGYTDYRMGTGAYSHTPINNYLGIYIADDINTNNPQFTDLREDVPSVVDYLAIQSKNDVMYAPWFSPARAEVNSVIAPNNGPRINFKSPANISDYDLAYPKGVNAIVKEDSVVKFHGNRSLLLANNKMLSKHQVADLLVYSLRELNPLVKLGEFQPNDVKFWKETYRKVKPFIVDVLEKGRAIVPGENVNWFWIGDQEANRIEDAEYNESTNLEAGEYKIKFVFIPIGATEFITVDLVVTDSNTLKAVVQ